MRWTRRRVRPSGNGRQLSARHARQEALVQIGCFGETFRSGMDALPIGQDGIPDVGRSGILEAELREIELQWTRLNLTVVGFSCLCALARRA